MSRGTGNGNKVLGVPSPVSNLRSHVSRLESRGFNG